MLLNVNFYCKNFPWIMLRGRIRLIHRMSTGELKNYINSLKILFGIRIYVFQGLKELWSQEIISKNYIELRSKNRVYYIIYKNFNHLNHKIFCFNFQVSAYSSFPLNFIIQNKTLCILDIIFFMFAKKRQKFNPQKYGKDVGIVSLSFVRKIQNKRNNIYKSSISSTIWS